MTQDRVGGIGAAISDVIGARIRDLRERQRMSRDDLAAAAREAGAPETLTGTVIRFLETGRPGRDGRRTRFFTLDELLGLAAGLEAPPLELLGDAAVLIAGDAAPAGCPACDGSPGALEKRVRADVAALEDLAELEPSLAETAYVLAAAIDAGGGEGGKQLPALTRELRACLEQIAAGRRGRAEPDEDVDDDGLDDLDSPDGDGPDFDDLPE